MKYLDLKLLLLFIIVIFVGSKIYSQDFLDADSFSDKIA